MKSIKTVFAILLLALTISCSDENKDTGIPDATSSTPLSNADITLTAGGKEFKLSGPCGWAVAGGAHYIGANQSDNNLKMFSAFFDIKELPTKTTTYTLREYSLVEDESYVNMNISEISGNTLTSWISKSTSGKLKLVVEGNKITVDLAGIILYPEPKTIYEVGNVGAFANNGVLTGTLTFYK